MRKVKFAQRWETGSKLVNVGIPFVITYHIKLKKSADYEKARTPFVSGGIC